MNITAVKNLGDKDPAQYVKLLQLIDEKTEYEDALAEINNEGLMETFRLHVYHEYGAVGAVYPVKGFDNIVENIEQLIGENNFSEVEVFEVDGYNRGIEHEQAPPDVDTYTRTTFK